MTLARRGAALVLVLLALATLGLTAAALLASAAALRDDVRGSLAALHARTLAASAVARVWRSWDGAAHVDDRLGDVVESIEASPSAIASVQRVRLHPQLWWVAADARALASLRARPVRHAAALALHLAMSPAAPAAAVSTAGPVSIAAGAVVSGHDSVPPGWPCAVAAEAGTSGYAVLHERGTVIAAPVASIRGALGTFDAGSPADPLPAWSAAPTLAVARATIRPAPGATVAPEPAERDGICLHSGESWGEPDRAVAAPLGCRRRWVLVHAAHPLTIAGGRAQGILVADSALHLTAGARFVGLIVARGSVRLEAASVLGALIILRDPARPAPTVFIGAGASVTRSRCAVVAALLGGPMLAPAEPGGWMTLW